MIYGLNCEKILIKKNVEDNIMYKKNFLYGYAQIINWFISWMLFGFVNASGANVYRTGVAELHGIDYSSILQVGSVAGWISAFAFIAVPSIIKRIGAKNLLVISAILGGISFALTPLFNNIIAIGFFIGCNEIFTCIYCVSTTMVLVSKWFPRKKGTIMGIITAAGIFSSIIILPAFNSIMNANGIKTAMMTFGIITAVYGIISIWGLKETPEEAGLLPDNMPLDKGDTSAIGIKDEYWKFKTILKKKNFWYVSIGWGLELLGTIGFITIAVSYMVMQGIAIERAIFAMGVNGIIQFFTSTISGFIDQKIGPLKTSIFIFALQFAGFMICAFYGGGNSLIIMLAVWLILGTFGASNNLYSSQPLSIFGPKNFAAAFNGLCFITGITKPFGQFIAGRSLAVTGDYIMAFKIYAALMIVGLILIILAGDKKIVPKQVEA